MGIRFGPVKVSSRGVRARVGPRIARVHVGTGRPGISTGIGPFGAHAPIGGSRRVNAGNIRHDQPVPLAVTPAGTVTPPGHPDVIAHKFELA